MMEPIPQRIPKGQLRLTVFFLFPEMLPAGLGL
jgi:hypothetical protein